VTARTLAIALVGMLVAPAIAHARHCHDTSPVVGLSRCRRFGAWSFNSSLALEVGPVAMRLDPGSIATDAYGTLADGTLATYHVVGAGPVTAAGVRIRDYLSWGRNFHIGAEADIVGIVDGPVLVVADTAARTTTTPAHAGGSIGVAKLVVGQHATAGGLTLGGELAPGLRIAEYSLPELPRSVKGPGQAWFVLEAHARAELWLTPQISLAGEVGTNLLNARDITLGVAIGIHLLPYDRAR
jgi:hypothetical protein